MNKALLTFDWDWAPDVLVEPIIDRLIEYRIPSIWFVTHSTPLLDKLRTYEELFELGIHPNFFKGSSQGNTEDEVVEYLLKIVPEARSVRTHGLYQSSNLILKLGSQYGLKFDFSLFLPGCVIQPHEFFFGEQRITRIPYNWEDDVAMFYPSGLQNSYEHISKIEKVIFDFHPIHVALNSTSLQSYDTLRKVNPNLSDWTKEFCYPLVDIEVVGINSILDTLITSQRNVLLTLDNFLENENRSDWAN
ncbi:polysaccharide deacetylase WbmS family protein [Roseivirga thermotolerans]|uniref:polysaccharide deacetylase WbmS family protein n=1 Tax=Roseivirga thermotolerans TaxID=1758176 RepID=UPI0027402066|nr:hypothetical protein [Roseivirga thermotolerans]